MVISGVSSNPAENIAMMQRNLQQSPNNISKIAATTKVEEPPEVQRAINEGSTATSIERVQGIGQQITVPVEEVSGQANSPSLTSSVQKPLGYDVYKGPVQLLDLEKGTTDATLKAVNESAAQLKAPSAFQAAQQAIQVQKSGFISVT